LSLRENSLVRPSGAPSPHFAGRSENGGRLIANLKGSAFAAGSRPGGRRARVRLPLIMSWVFVLLAGVLVIGFFIKVGTYQGIEQLDRHSGQKGDGGPASRTAVSTSTFSGFDKNEQPFQIAAAKAVRDASDPGAVALEQVSGNVRRDDGAVLNFSARQGRYMIKPKLLTLTGDVHLVSEGRFVASLSQADVDVDNKGLVSNHPVVVQLTDGVIHAGTMAVSDNGDRVLFTGRVKAHFGNNGGKSDMQ
jgi:lipopolysaccharide export system protein LptC